ncbi:hypothetical protein TSUD_335950 [Trifolium subterraneum]|uniref:Uncharacterized protein n=1 Tax=Trifolium subterraneum TaxID=3900 RepID=A0A2Z6LMJ2_TRISU|nr:hypothetical protein TSUD_335950 [Trifolium subterraneum]
MAEPPRPPPSLTSLCIDDLTRHLLSGDDYVVQDIYELPSHLLDELISRLPPIALYNFNLHMPFQDLNKEDFPHDDSTNNKRKRSSAWNLNTAWQKLFTLRWPNIINQIQPTDWQQTYWESHLQNCLDEAAEIALITSFKGSIGDIQISGIVRDVGYEKG